MNKDGMTRRNFLFFCALASVFAAGVASQLKNDVGESLMNWNATRYQLAKIIGFLARVETREDKYEDYYATDYELVTPQNVHPDQFMRMDNDPYFRGKEYYLVTAVKKSGDELVQRRFVYTKEDALKLGLKKLKGSEKVGDEKNVVLDQRITNVTLGQYLEEFLGSPLARIFPRVHSFTATPEDGGEVRNINELLRKGKINSNLKLGYQAPEPK